VTNVAEVIALHNKFTSWSAWRAKASICNWRGMTRRAGARRSTRAGWSTRRRARREPGESACRGATQRRRGRHCGGRV